jgi:hypothetical protein
VTPRSAFPFDRLEKWRQTLDSQPLTLVGNLVSAARRVAGLYAGEAKLPVQLLLLHLLVNVRRQLDAEIEAVIGWARADDVPREAIGRALGLQRGGNLNKVHGRHEAIRKWLATPEPGGLMVGGREARHEDFPLARP